MSRLGETAPKIFGCKRVECIHLGTTVSCEVYGGQDQQAGKIANA